MHQQTSQSQNKDRKLGEELAISQRDMVLTQFAFIGLIVMYPSKFGIHKNVDKTLERLIYFWRVIGSLLGIRDEHNLCNGSLSEVQQRCNEIFAECFTPALKKLSPERFHMAKLILVGTSEWVYCTRFRSTMRYLFECTNINKDYAWTDFTFMEWFSYVALKNVMTYGLKFAFVRFIINKLFSLAVWRLTQKSFIQTIVENLESINRIRT